MVLEYLEGWSLDQFLRALPYSAGLAASRICQGWLHQGFFGNCYPVDPQERNVLIRSNHQIFFRDCDLAALPKTAKENLWNYLTAVATDDPDTAAFHLLSEMSTLPHTRVDPEAFRSSFRQAACFGVLEPILGTNSNSLSQLVFQQWKTALEHGYIPRPHLLSLTAVCFPSPELAARYLPQEIHSERLSKNSVSLEPYSDSRNSQNGVTSCASLINLQLHLRNFPKRSTMLSATQPALHMKACS
jgi:predicted unusual protein kinase regulating ubiquinone biosynthesis (AarF/ABC1/UbiB family)